MPKVQDFYSINENKKPIEKRVYHDNSACAPGRDIPINERLSGKGGYRPATSGPDQTNKGR